MRRRRSHRFALAFSEAVRLVAEDYALFVRGIGRLQPEDDPKGFAARHAAARACLGHLEALLELVGEDAGIEHVRDSFALLHEAREALTPLPGLPPPGGDGSADAEEGC